MTDRRNRDVAALLAWLRDVRTWHRRYRQWVLTGENHPGWFPPSPTRILGGYDARF
jgi:hypothetical protein